MKSVLLSNAKINVGLNVTKKREDGYHELEMIMLPIDLYDKMEVEVFETEENNIEITTNKDYIPVDYRNILNKTYKLFYDNTNFKRRKIKVYLEKNIPVEAGLGGGSSNAAFFFKFLNTYYKNFYSEKELIDLGKKIGADVPFFIKNKSSFVTGIGENIKEIKNNLENKLLLIKPNFGLSTKDVYENLKNVKEKKYADMNKLINGLETNDISLVKENIENNLNQSAILLKKEVKDFENSINDFIKKEENLNLKFFMTGSGSVYYSFLDKKCDEEYILKLFQKKYEGLFVSINEFL
ncbi:4-(cytidine 5'-diphospho)-2-C-methyl-D-erythritol kinase [Candidatus Gracilibacteria bacterium]|nr:4-(cytidine 5'-diphospho)-2-C-methyl-D-erythritol kinase [Candidatus Gracilibacteria bacterium]